MTESSDYQVFGLRIRSEVPLPELFPAPGDGAADVTIRRGSIAAIDGAAGLRSEAGALLLTIPDVGRYRIEGGREIVIDPNAGVPARNVRLYLLGSAFGALLHQRGLLPLHANAVEIDGKAVAFMGESGAGKSTLAAWFHDRGYRVIADDVCVIGFDGVGRPYAAPGLPRLRLWADAMQFVGHGIGEYPRSYFGDQECKKFDVPIDPALAAHSGVELRALYLLERGDEFSITELRGMEAAETLFANTYRGSYVSMANGQKDHWQSAVRLVRAAPVYRVVRQWDLAKLDEQCCRMLANAMTALASET